MWDCVYMCAYACACVCAKRGDHRGGWLLRKDDFSSCTTYRAPPRPYTGSISILEKSTLGIENGDERTSEGGMETAGSRWTEGGLRRLCARGRKRCENATKRTKRGEHGCRVYERACTAPTPFLTAATFRFFQYRPAQLSAKDFRGFCPRPETEGQTTR